MSVCAIAMVAANSAVSAPVQAISDEAPGAAAEGLQPELGRARGRAGGVGDGLARFDGQRLDRFLPAQCISMDIAADGSAWVLAADDLPYVFDDDALRATVHRRL